MGPNIEPNVRHVVDATGQYAIPGVIDAHTHPNYLDDLEAVSKTAAHGGVTTLIHYAFASRKRDFCRRSSNTRKRVKNVRSRILDYTEDYWIQRTRPARYPTQ